nr:MAG TPA: hypothetical protein [Bacteriophage sp.]
MFCHNFYILKVGSLVGFEPTFAYKNMQVYQYIGY